MGSTDALTCELARLQVNPSASRRSHVPYCIGHLRSCVIYNTEGHDHDDQRATSKNRQGGPDRGRRCASRKVLTSCSYQ
jgi:hypothetical protein